MGGRDPRQLFRSHLSSELKIHSKMYVFLSHRLLGMFLPIIPNVAQWAIGGIEMEFPILHKFNTTKHNSYFLHTYHNRAVPNSI